MNSHVLHREVATRVRDRFPRPQLPDERNRLVGSRSPFGDRHLHGPKLLGILTTYPYAECHPTTRCSIQVGDLFGHEGRRVEREQQYRRSDTDPLGQRHQSGETLHRLWARVCRCDVSAHPQRIDRLCLPVGDRIAIRADDESDLQIGGRHAHSPGLASPRLRRAWSSMWSMRKARASAGFNSSTSLSSSS